MTRHRITLLILLVLVAVPVSVAVAQSEPILRLTVQAVPEQAQKTSWWISISRLLGTKIVRPKEGTKFVVQASAYASSPLQTDSTPCLTAAGTTVRPGVVATNFLPLGTLLTINGDVFIVEDRMNSRYGGHYLDIWYPSTSQALTFGRRNIEIEVVGYGKPGQQLSREVGEGAPNVVRRANLRFVAFTRTLSAFLSTKISGDVDRFDIACPQADVSSVDETE